MTIMPFPEKQSKATEAATKPPIVVDGVALIPEREYLDLAHEVTVLKKKLELSTEAARLNRDTIRRQQMAISDGEHKAARLEAELAAARETVADARKALPILVEQTKAETLGAAADLVQQLVSDALSNLSLAVSYHDDIVDLWAFSRAHKESRRNLVAEIIGAHVRELRPFVPVCSTCGLQLNADGEPTCQVCPLCDSHFPPEENCTTPSCLELEIQLTAADMRNNEEREA